MKIKVDKEEYKALLKRVERLESKVNEEDFTLYENWRWTREALEELMEHYFSNRCMTVVMKRDKNEIIAEIRKQAMNNLFKEDK